MSGEEDLYLNQSEADALFFSDALLGNADELDFESFGHATGLDDGTFNGITGLGLTSFEARDVFKLNSGSFVDEIEAKCEITHPTELAANNVHSFSNGTSSSDGTFVFNKPTLDLEGMGMAYGVSGLYLQGNMSPSAEKMNGLTLGQMPGYSTYETKQFMSAPPPVASAAPPVATKGMSRFGSQEMMAAAENGALQEAATTSPVLSPSSSDGKGGRRQDSGTDFDDQVDGDGDGLQPLPQMRRSSMQRSFSSHALGQLRHMSPATHSISEMRQSQQVERGAAGGGGLTSPGARLQQPSLAEFQNVGMRPMSVGMRRVYSAGDIQTLNGMQGGLGGGASPSFDDGNYRVGKYSMEERKIRIHRYQQKRTQRNFNKKIKYACRKTLADSRPRVRGRFAKNMDDDIPVAVLGRKREDDDDDEQGDAHVGERANGFHFDNSSGDYSDVLTSIKVEHQRVNSM